MSDIGTLLEDADTLFLLAVAFVLTSAMLFDCMTVVSLHMIVIFAIP